MDDAVSSGLIIILNILRKFGRFIIRKNQVLTGGDINCGKVGIILQAGSGLADGGQNPALNIDLIQTRIVKFDRIFNILA